MLKEATECDGDVRNTIMDNTMFHACEKDDQRSIDLKTLVEHCWSSTVDKQQEKELTVFRSMGEKCVEKTHRSNSVLLNAIRRKPAAASVLQQAETGCAVEQELFQSQHAAILEPGPAAQQTFSSSHEKSMQVNTSPRRARMPEDDYATVRPR